MLRTESDIEKAVKDQYDKEVELRKRWDADFGYYRLDEYNRGKDYKSVTANKPRTLADLLIDFLVRAKLQIRIPVDKAMEGERGNQADAERLLIGLLKLNDFRLGGLALPSLREQMVWHSFIRGWYVLRAYINKDNNGATKPLIDVWDRYHTFYDLSVPWVCHTRTATASQIKAEYDIDISGKKGTVYDFWDDEVNSIHVKGAGNLLHLGTGGKFVKEPKEHGLDHMPCYVVPCGAMPPIESSQYTDTIKDLGESWLAANRNLVDPMNELFSDLLTIVARGAKIPLGGYGKGGGLTLDESPYKLDKDQAVLIPLDKDKEQEIKPLIEPTMPRDAASIINIFGMLWQEGGVSESLFGHLPFQISGYALHQTRESASKAIGSALTGIQKGGDWLLRELLLQYKTGFKPVRVEGRDNQGQYFGPVELKPSDIKGDWFPEYRLMPELPENEMERWAMARIAKEIGLPLQTIYDKLLGIQDTDLQSDLSLEEWGKELPPVKLRRLANIFLKLNRPDLAQEVMNMLNQPLPEQKKPPKSEAVQPEFQTGVPPEVFPPEMLGRTPTAPPEIPIERYI